MNIHCCYHHFHGHCYIILYSCSPISIHLGVWLLFREGVLSLATKAHQGSHQGCSSGGPFWVQQPPLDPFFTTPPTPWGARSCPARRKTLHHSNSRFREQHWWQPSQFLQGRHDPGRSQTPRTFLAAPPRAELWGTKGQIWRRVKVENAAL